MIYVACLTAEIMAIWVAINVAFVWLLHRRARILASYRQRTESSI